MASLFEAYITNLGKYNEGELVGESSLWDNGFLPPPAPCSAGTARGDRRK